MVLHSASLPSAMNPSIILKHLIINVGPTKEILLRLQVCSTYVMWRNIQFRNDNLLHGEGGRAIIGGKTIDFVDSS